MRLEEAGRRVKSAAALEELRLEFLGRKSGALTRLMAGLAALPDEDRPEAGRLVNALKAEVEDALRRLESGLRSADKRPPSMDWTLPGLQRLPGCPHPVRVFLKQIEAIFVSLGFSVEEGPEVETDYYNFEALNFPIDHPARDDWDTLYLAGGLLLRTHTSPVQIRVMEKQKPPIRMINPGRVFRKETPDPTHLPMFFQVEGLLVDEGVTFAHLKGTLEYFLRRLFSEKLKIRFRPSFFPFTEPSAEVDIECLVCRGRDAECRVCKGTGWKEILGAGMVDPQVLKNVNIDPEKYSGWAFGMGIERTAMFAYQIPDMRQFYENDMRFIRQFRNK
ncbi:MAG: phenylalanine--tRNA ligase subunit alpha [Candidatus Aminicenantes bacterium RBG_13_62_12]|nr:MAG: phenylalanine--tRNA ligase subunit alpha [Candidatus Aminicenantes bacterium RBG_13_62_12]